MEDREFALYQRTTEVYLRYGIKNITMDLMSRELKVSKKTLYKYVDDRPELVAKSMQWKLAGDVKVIKGILSKNLNAIEELWEIKNFEYNNLLNVHPSLYFDLQQYYPEAWKYCENYRNEFLYNTFLSNIKKGIKEGLYKKDFSIEVITRLYIFKVAVIFDSRIFPFSKFQLAELYNEAVKYHLSGIVSEYGAQEMKQHLMQSSGQLISDLAY